MVVGWASLFCELIWVMISDKIGRKPALVLIYLLHAVSFSLFALWPEPAGLGFVTLFFGIGQAVGPSVAGAIADATGSLAPALLLAGGVSLLGAVGAMFLRPIGGRAPGRM